MYKSELNSQYIDLPPHPSLTTINKPKDLSANVTDAPACGKCAMVDETPLDKYKKISSKKGEKNDRKTIPFWTQNPNILFDPVYIWEFFPSDGMTFEQKLNAITRMVLVLTIISFLYTQKTRILFIAFFTVLAICLLYYTQPKPILSKLHKEGFSNFGPDPNMPPLGDYHKKPTPITKMDIPTPENPFSNVLMTDYDFNPNKPPAIPCFTKEGHNTILEEAKTMVIKNNPGQPDIADKLFTDLGDQMTFEQSLQPFYSNPATTIPNDQAAFADFCYGTMISAKEGNMQALARSNPPRHNMI